ncbi:MAG: Hpt domain-containing protein [Holophagales bacterium]|nr:Hpt domain-containing protein [Holophagales bacterium]
MTEKREKLLERIDGCRNVIWQLQNALLQLSVERGNQELVEQAVTDLGRLSRRLGDGDGDGAVLAVALDVAAAGVAAGTLGEDGVSALYELVEALALTSQEGTDRLERIVGRLRGEKATEPVPPQELVDSPGEADPDDLKLFCAEAREHLGSVEASLLELERTGSPEVIAEVFRAVHSIKGGAQYVGLKATATLAHRTEALLDRLRRGERNATSEVVAALLAATDGLSGLIRAAETGGPSDVDTGALVERVEKVLANAAPPAAGTLQAPRQAAETVAPAVDQAPKETPRTGLDEDVEALFPAVPVETQEGLGSDFDLFAREYRANAAELHRFLANLDGVAREPEEARLLARALHSLKGIAGFIGAVDMEKLASALDLLLERVFRHRTDVPPDVKRIAARTEEALENLFESLSDGKEKDTDVMGLLAQLAALREREEKTMAWGEEPAPAATESWDADPLRARLGAVEAAVAAGDADRLALALEDLGSTAELQGLDELSDAAQAAARAAAGFVAGGGRDLVERLTALLPDGEDLLAPPTAPEPAAKLAEAPGPGPMPKALETSIVEDDFDQDLVRIYLDTTSSRLGTIGEMLARGASSEAAELLGDMASAAAYMGYEPLAGHFAGAREALERPLAGLSSIGEGLARAARSVEELRQRLSPGAVSASARRSDAEEEELEQIFREAARSHLGDLFANVLALEHGTEPERLDAVNHHLGCLHSAATNMGRGEAVATIERAQSTLERALEPGVALSRDAVGALGSVVESLYRVCGLVPPAPRVAPAPRPADAETSREVVAAPAVDTPTHDSAAIGSPLAAAEETDAARGLVEAQTTVRVDTKKIDDLMNMVAELVVNRSSFLVLSSSVREVLVRLVDSGRVGQVESRDLRHVLDRYDETTTDLGRVSNQLQEGVMRIRMMPVRTLFSRVPRLVRDLALREGKQVRVVFSGEETELDKTVIEQLSDPLVHLLRNSISHGLEAPADRAAAGKGSEGTLRIAARHQGNMVILDVEDDGRGIDLEAVRRVLVDRGLSSPVEAARLAPRDLMAALFLPGFSTARTVSDVSGRGVGLDVVKRNIESLGGQIEVFTDAGRSTRFSIRIPLTMAIMQALLVRVAEEVYSIPVSAVIQTVKVGRSDISTVEGQEVLTLRGKVVPLVRLSDVFDYRYHEETGQGPAERAEGESLYAVVLQGEGREIAIAAEGMIGSQDLVIKSLEDDLVDARGVAGAAILGDGTVTLILDVPEIQKMAVDRERYRERRKSDTMRAFDRLVRDRVPAEAGLVH